MPPDHQPQAHLFCARFGLDIDTIVSLILIIQRQGAPDEDVRAAAANIEKNLRDVDFKPEFVDDGEDESGNIVINAYWRSITVYDRWHAQRESGWFYQGLPISGQIGVLLIEMRPSVRDFETSFSHRTPEGVAHLSENWSGPTLEHSYHGSARDRIPRSQTDTLEPHGTFEFDIAANEDPKHKIVSAIAPSNFVVIRSGQCWANTRGDEASYYEEDLQPKLGAAMGELYDDTKYGTVGNHFVKLSGRERATYSLSFWRSLQHLEDWTVKSRKHVAIFKSRVDHEADVSGASAIQTYHEIYVLLSRQLNATFFNCDGTSAILRSRYLQI